jgi:aryl-alcohol dehydrogenase-like predicted oxidoreductase
MGGTPEVRRPLGLSGLTISRVALGCGNFGGVGSAPAFFGQGLTQDQAFELMDAAWEFGLTHFDTADAYGGGRSETAIGRWIASRGVRPQLTTKTYNPMRAGEDHGLNLNASPGSCTRAWNGSGSTTSSCTWRTISTRTYLCPRPSARSSRPGPAVPSAPTG